MIYMDEKAWEERKRQLNREARDIDWIVLTTEQKFARADFSIGEISESNDLDPSVPLTDKQDEWVKHVNVWRNATNQPTRPNHYKRGGMECREAIAAAVADLNGEDAFDIGNAMKYLWRFDSKGHPVADLNKAIQYIRFVLERRE